MDELMVCSRFEKNVWGGRSVDRRKSALVVQGDGRLGSPDGRVRGRKRT